MHQVENFWSPTFWVQRVTQIPSDLDIVFIADDYPLSHTFEIKWKVETALGVLLFFSLVILKSFRAILIWNERGIKPISIFVTYMISTFHTIHWQDRTDNQPLC